MIDWKRVAEMNGLTEEEFETQVLACAASIGAVRIDEEGGDGFLMAIFADETSEIHLLIQRKTEDLTGVTTH